jgi:hypothetical protein
MSKIVAELEVKNTNAAAVAKGVRGKIEKEMGPLRRLNIGGGIAKGMAILGGATIAAGAAIIAGTKAALDFGGQLSDLSNRTGIAAGDLQVMGQAFKNNGLSIEAVGPAVNRLQKALAGVNEDGQATGGIFARLGLNMEEMMAAAPDEQFRRVGAAISGLSDPTERTAAAMAIFGRSGGELMALFNSPDAFGQAAKEVGAQAAIMDRNAALFDDISDKLALAGLKMQGFFIGVADYVAPVLQPLLDWFASQDLAAQGQAFGKAIATAIQMLVDGTIWNALGDTLTLMGANFVNTITSGINQVIATMASIPGFGGLGSLQIPQIDTSGIEQNLGNAMLAAQGKVEAAREAADAKAAGRQPAGGGLDQMAAAGGGGGKGGPSVQRMFSTSMGLFVKDPLLAETRRTNTILTKIQTGIENLKTGVANATQPGALRFT